ncbi:MAG: ATP-binding cassette domain-containing protein [Bacteroidota bacterium]
MNILSANNIVKRYASHTALNDVSIEIPRESVFGLLGPNGAGKTSLIRIINQITGPDSGELFFEGEKLEQRHVELIGYLPEERGLYKKMAVGEQALYLAQLKGMSSIDARKKLKYWFEKFEIAAWWNKKVEELSKGMQQKVQFIVTVLHEPKLLILDEPFSGFDPINANIIKNEILHLKKQGSTILFSTHNMGSVEELCDNIALIHKSKKILNGSVKDIRKQYKTNTYELEFTGNMMGFTNAMWTGAELLEHTTDGEQNKALVRLLGKTTSNDLLQAIIPVAQIQMFKEIVPSMNDIFIKVVGDESALGTQSNFTE